MPAPARLGLTRSNENPARATRAVFVDVLVRQGDAFFSSSMECAGFESPG